MKKLLALFLLLPPAVAYADRLDGDYGIVLDGGAGAGAPLKIGTSEFLADEARDQLLLGLDSSIGNQLVITAYGNIGKDHDHAAQADPTLFVHSATDPDSDNTEWVSMYHDQTNSNIESGSGNINLKIATSTKMQILPTAVFANVDFYTLSNNAFRIGSSTGLLSRVSTSFTQFVWAVGSDAGNQMVFTDFDNQSKDHDHATPTNPTLFIHSDTDPDSDNTQYMSLSHDQTDSVISTGAGGVNISHTNGDGDHVGFDRAEADLTSVSGATVTSSSLIPAGSIVIAVSTAVTTALGTTNSTTGYQVGDGTDADAFGAITGTADTTRSRRTDWTITSAPVYASATDIVLTAVGGNFDGTGDIKVVVWYIDDPALN
jgi:hypothetical protein